MKNYFENDPSPRSISVKKCACGCGNLFKPRRRDQIYLNKQHADQYHNDKKSKEKKALDDILKKNERILEECFYSHIHDSENSHGSVEILLLRLKIKGFNFKVYPPTSYDKQKRLYYTSNYYYSVYNEPFSKIEMVKIFKM